MYYTHVDANGQFTFSNDSCSFLPISSDLTGFNNHSTRTVSLSDDRTVYVFEGDLDF